MKRMRSESPKTTLPPAGSSATFDQPSPIQSAGRATTSPAMGPAAAMSKSELRSRADDGAEGAEEEGRRRGNEVRQADRGAIGAGHEVVAELVGAQDGEESEGKRHAVEQACGLGERIEGQEGSRSRHDGRYHGEDEEEDVDARLRGHLHVHEGQRAHP